MLPPGHIAAGYLAAKIAGHFIPALNSPKYLALTSFFSFFPDLDYFIAFARTRKWIIDKQISHRDFPTHAPLLYLLVFSIWYVVFGQTRLLAWTFLIGTWSHFILDTFSASGIPWLYPFTNKRFGLTLDLRNLPSTENFFEYWLEFVKEYAKTAVFKAELLISVIALIFLIFHY